MGTAGFLRSVNATIKRFDKANKQIERENEKQRKEYQKKLSFQNAQEEVEDFEQYIEALKSVHLGCEEEINWEGILQSDEPQKPINYKQNEEKAMTKYNSYKPNFFDKVFKSDTKKLEKLENEIKNAKSEDDQIYKEEVKKYNEGIEEIKEAKIIAEKVLRKDFKIYTKVIEEMSPFKKIEYIGSTLSFNILNSEIIEVEVKVLEDSVIPKDYKTLLKSGKVSLKPFPVGKYYDIYQDYVCSVTLRIARELFAILPITKVVINAMGEEVNKSTGYKEEICILSVLIPKLELEKLNIEQIDPSDSMKNFLCNMEFKKTGGLKKVEKIKI